MKLHHDKHHQAYVTNLNGAIDKHPELATKSPEDLIRHLSAIPEDIRKIVQNNGGGHVNHSMFWQIMKPAGEANPTAPSQPRSRPTSATSRASRSSSTRPPPSSSAPAGDGSSSRPASSRSSPRPTRTIPSPRGSIRYSATTSGSTPTTSSTRTAAQSTSPPGGTPSTGTRSTNASPPPRASKPLTSAPSWRRLPLRQDGASHCAGAVSTTSLLGADSLPAMSTAVTR